MFPFPSTEREVGEERALKVKRLRTFRPISYTYKKKKKKERRNLISRCLKEREREVGEERALKIKRFRSIKYTYT